MVAFCVLDLVFTIIHFSTFLALVRTDGLLRKHQNKNLQISNFSCFHLSSIRKYRCNRIWYLEQLINKFYQFCTVMYDNWNDLGSTSNKFSYGLRIGTSASKYVSK